MKLRWVKAKDDETSILAYKPNSGLMNQGERIGLKLQYRGEYVPHELGGYSPKWQDVEFEEEIE
jgi:hypothetical protein